MNETGQISNSIGMRLILVPAGEFIMGGDESAADTAAFFYKRFRLAFSSMRLPPSERDLPELFTCEHPAHRVRITRPFYLGVHHVTRGDFGQFVSETGYKTDAEKGRRPGGGGWDAEKREFGVSKDYSSRNTGFVQTDEHPVVNVSWNDAIAFCEWLRHKEGKDYRLPTEAEWEYACRAGTSTRYYSGDDPETLATVGNVADGASKAMFPDWTWTINANGGYAFTAPVGSFRPNAFGLYDMHGNAMQWCSDWSDWYAEDYYGKSPGDDPTGPETGGSHVLRGGAWNCQVDAARSAARFYATPEFQADNIGFRVAMTI